MVRLQEMAYDAVNAMQSAQRFAVHRLYIELASFTSEYLAHQDLEERLVMPALEQAIGVEAVHRDPRCDRREHPARARWRRRSR